MKRFVTSRWTYIFPKGRNFALFNSRNLEVLYVDKDVADLMSLFNKPHKIDEAFSFLKNIKDRKKIKEVINMLIKAKFIVLEDVNEIEELQKWTVAEIKNREAKLGQSSRLNALRVVLTERCNFNCNYCFVQKKKINRSNDISFKILIDAVNLLSSLNKEESIEIQFFGGEPLIRFDLIIKTVEYVQNLIKKGVIKKAYYGITTNGTLIDDKIARFFKKNKFLVSISIDGWKSLHNLNRRYFNKRGTFDDTMKGLEILQKNKNDIGVLITPSENNLKSLAKACEYIITKLGCDFITINTPQPIKGNWDVDGKLFSQQIKKCFKIAKKYKTTINSFGTRVFYALDEKKPLVLSCSKFGDDYTATLTPDGKISPCIVSWQHKDILIPMNKFSYHGDFSKWKLTSPYFFDKCIHCPAMNVCGGPCPLEVYEMKNFSKPIDHERCSFFKDFLESVI